MLKSKLSGKTFKRNLAPCEAVTPPGAVLRPRRARDPDRRPRPRHVLARPRRRDGRRPGRLRLRRQPLRREPPLRARARARHRRPRGPAHGDPPLRHLRSGEDGLHAPPARSPASSSTTTRSPSTTATCAWPRPRSRRGCRRAAAGASSSRVTVLRQDGAKLDAGRRRRRARRGRAHLRRALHGRARLRRHVPAGRPAVHARPQRSDRAQGRRRAEDPRLLRLSAPGRREPAARASAARGRACKASLFDVSEHGGAAARSRSCSSASSSTAVEFEPHAFLYWPPTNLAVMPLQTYGEPPFLGAVGVRVAPPRATEAGRDRPPQRRARRRRARSSARW